MVDASPMDPAAILLRVEGIERVAKTDGTYLKSDWTWLCQQLRTALADTRRVDSIIDLAKQATTRPLCITICANGETRIEWDYAFLNKDGLSLREAIDAMAATPRENNDR